MPYPSNETQRVLESLNSRITLLDARTIDIQLKLSEMLTRKEFNSRVKPLERICWAAMGSTGITLASVIGVSALS